MIVAVTPGIKLQKPVPRQPVSMGEIAALNRVDIKQFKRLETSLAALVFDDISGISTTQLDSSWKLDFLTKLVWPLRPIRKEWSATMQTIHKDKDHPGVSAISFLPMTDLNPSDMTCICSTLPYLSMETSRHKVKSIITFDQPLYWKALKIISHERESGPLSSIVLRLGAFHMQMSSLRSIGYIMQNSGLRRLLETVYADNAVDHMLSGKAVSRAVRGHFLVDTVLTSLLDPSSNWCGTDSRMLLILQKALVSMQ